MENIGVMKVLQFQDATSNTSHNFFNKPLSKPTQDKNKFFIFGKNTKATAKVNKSSKKPVKVKRHLEDEIKVVVTSELNVSNNNYAFAEKEIDFNYELIKSKRVSEISDKGNRIFRPQSAKVPKNFMRNFKKKKYYDLHNLGNGLENKPFINNQFFSLENNSVSNFNSKPFNSKKSSNKPSSRKILNKSTNLSKKVNIPSNEYNKLYNVIDHDNKQVDEQINNFNDESFEYFQKDISVVQDNIERLLNDNINQSNYEEQENKNQDEILKIINKNPDRFKISKELFQEIKATVEENKKPSRIPNSAKPRIDVIKENKKNNPFNRIKVNSPKKQPSDNKLNNPNLKINISSNNIEKELKKIKTSYDNMPKKEQIRLRHLIPKKKVLTDYERQESFLRKDSNGKQKNSEREKKAEDKKLSSKHIQSGTVLKPYKKLLNKMHEKEEKTTNKMKCRERKKPSEDNLNNYYDYIYLEKKGKLKILSSDHPWVNDD